MHYLLGESGESGQAADTGSATHAAIAAWHQNGQDPAAAIRSMIGKYGDFPRADLDEAAALFLLYSQDARNIEAEVVAVERQIEFRLPPAPEDPTQAPILIQGTVDQVRLENGVLRVHDVKTSKRPGVDLLRAHQYQVAAYCIGASHYFGKPVHPGCLICPRGYRPNSPTTNWPGVFFPYPWRFEDAGFILWGVRRVVAAVRSGEIWHNGGDHCRYCPGTCPEICLPMLQELVDFRTMKIGALSLPVTETDMKPLDLEF